MGEARGFDFVKVRRPGLYITCDVCDYREWFYEDPRLPHVDEQAAAHGWVRFGPSGQDLCWKCQGASPNTIIQVKDALAPAPGPGTVADPSPRTTIAEGPARSDADHPRAGWPLPEGVLPRSEPSD